MAIIGNLLVNLGMRTAAFDKGISKSKRGLTTFHRHTQTVSKGITSAMAAIAAPLAGIFAVYKVQQFISGQMDAVDATGKLAERIGITTEALVGLQHAGKLSGVRDLTPLLERMNKELFDAALKGDATARMLESVGLSAKDLFVAGTEQSIHRIADAIAATEDPALRLRVAMELFGRRAGPAMVNMLAEGSEGLEAMQADAEKLGLTFDHMDFKMIERANDAITRLKEAFVGAARQAAIKLAPAIEILTNKITDFLTEGDGIAAWAGRAVDAVGKVVGFIADGLHWLSIQVVKTVNWIVKQVAGVIGEMAKTMSALPESWGMDPVAEALIAAHDGLQRFSGELFRAQHALETGPKPSEWFEAEAEKIGDATYNAMTSFINQLGKGTDIRTAFLEWQEAVKEAEEELENELKLHDKLKAAAGRIWEATRTPFEKIKADAQEIFELLNAGFLESETFQRAIDAVIDRARGLLGEARQTGKADILGRRVALEGLRMQREPNQMKTTETELNEINNWLQKIYAERGLS